MSNQSGRELAWVLGAHSFWGPQAQPDPSLDELQQWPPARQIPLHAGRQFSIYSKGAKRLANLV